MALNEIPPQAVADFLQAMEDAFAPHSLERRTSERYLYPTLQAVAPCTAASLPAESAFCQVRCRDISRGGLAFLWPTRPDFDHVVIRLSAGSARICLKGRVVRCLPSDDLSAGFLVCCQFCERME